jgi:MoxR-like ATPase
MKHYKYDEVKTLIKNDINTLLVGESGSGKSTLLLQIAEDLDYTFSSITMTRQTTVSNLLGFMSVTGTYVPSLFREAVEKGHMFVLEEIDSTDPNTILCLNTLENGYIAFPDGIIEVHKDFRLCATANPFDEHKSYTGRSILDASTLDRFDIVSLGRDNNLEKHLVGDKVIAQVDVAREIINMNNSSVRVSMRDAIRYKKRLELDLGDNYIENILKSEDLISKYHNSLSNIPKLQEETNTIDELWNAIQAQKDNK